MRLKPEKIEDLARKVLEELKNNPEVAIRGSEDAVFHEIKAVIEMDLKREDDMEEEVRNLLKAHMTRINKEDVNFTNLVRKAKQQMAKERGIDL